MRMMRNLTQAAVALCLVAGLAGPQIGAADEEVAFRDVPYVPTPQPVVDEMLKLARLKPSHLLYDLGSGDGRIVITAAREYGVRGVGVDIDPQRIAESRGNADREGVSERVTFIEGDLFEVDLGEADAVTLYLLSSVNLRLRPKLLAELRPGTRVVSHAFDMGEWEPDYATSVDGNMIFFWLVPADVAGEWSLVLTGPQGAPQTYAVSFEQEFQKVNGAAFIEGAHVPLEDVRLEGDELTFTVAYLDDNGQTVTQVFTGQVKGDVIEGKAEVREGTRAGDRTWNAQRSAPAQPRAAAR